MADEYDRVFEVFEFEGNGLQISNVFGFVGDIGMKVAKRTECRAFALCNVLQQVSAIAFSLRKSPGRLESVLYQAYRSTNELARARWSSPRRAG